MHLLGAIKDQCKKAREVRIVFIAQLSKAERGVISLNP